MVWATLIAIGLGYSEGIAADPAKSPPTPIAPATKAVAMTEQQHHHHLTTIESVLHELHQSIQLLHDGVHVAHHERAKGEAEIRKAIHLLEEHHAAHQKSIGKGQVNRSLPKQPQIKHSTSPQQSAVTDQQLRTAANRLHQSEKLVHAAMHQLHHVHGEHHHVHQAIHHLGEASHEISASLHVTQHLEKELLAANR
jgi:hypothetical protein